MEKICGFYASNMHFVTMILPYIKKQITNKIKIETFFEQDLNENINKFLNNFIINEELKKEIININWSNKKIKRIRDIEKIKNTNDNSKITFLISGSRKYIQEINKLLNNELNNNNKNNKRNDSNNIKIISCYKISLFNDDIKEILDENDYVINTSGIHKINEIFEGYKKEIAN